MNETTPSLRQQWENTRGPVMNTPVEESAWLSKTGAEKYRKAEGDVLKAWYIAQRGQAGIQAGINETRAENEFAEAAESMREIFRSFTRAYEQWMKDDRSKSLELSKFLPTDQDVKGWKIRMSPKDMRLLIRECLISTFGVDMPQWRQGVDELVGSVKERFIGREWNDEDVIYQDSDNDPKKEHTTKLPGVTMQAVLAGRIDGKIPVDELDGDVVRNIVSENLVQMRMIYFSERVLQTKKQYHGVPSTCRM